MAKHCLECAIIDSLDEIDEHNQLALVWCATHNKFEWHNLPMRLIGTDAYLDRTTKTGWKGAI